MDKNHPRMGRKSAASAFSGAGEGIEDKGGRKAVRERETAYAILYEDATIAEAFSSDSPALS